jgi:hypothetical protein
MSDWVYAQSHPSEQLARLHYFSVLKKTPGGAEIEFTITVKEFATPKDGALVFFAQADKQTNQAVAPYTPCGWGKTLLGALQECVREINRFPSQDAGAQAAEA